MPPPGITTYEGTTTVMLCSGCLEIPVFLVIPAIFTEVAEP